jgi:hypothetical protein
MSPGYTIGLPATQLHLVWGYVFLIGTASTDAVVVLEWGSNGVETP